MNVLIKEFRVLGNNRLFKEVLSDSFSFEHERKKEVHRKRFKEAKSLRLFLKDQNIVYVKSSKDKNEFLKLKLIHDAYLEKKPYDKIQKDNLEKLKFRTRDLLK